MAKNQGMGKSSSKGSGGKAAYRSALTGRFVGRTKDGISIFGPKARSRHFTHKEAREAVDAVRSLPRA